MDYVRDAKQIKRVQDKLAWMARREGNLVQPEEPADPQWIKGFEADQHVSLPEDFREIVSRTADGGNLPDACNIRYWKPLRIIDNCKVPLDVPYSPAEDLRTLRGGLAEIPNPSKLPGQILIMGGDHLGWSLVTAGSCFGEVWTIGSFGVRRAPACTFAQWLELVLDGNLEAYLTYCLTGEEGRMGRSRRFQDVIGTDFTWSEEASPAEQCARWLEDNRFVHQGPGDGWAGYLRSQLCQTLALLPQERDEKLSARRAAQQKPGWQWDKEQAAKWAQIGELIQVVRAAEANGEQWGSADPQEEELFRRAAELVHQKRFQARGEGIRDLSFLEGLAHLKEVDLWDNDIEDLSPLASLTGLRELWLPYNLISDLSPLAGLDKLVQLKVYGNRITSLEPLRGLTNLNVLNLRGNPLESGTLACLRKCKRLGMLDLSNTGLGDISDLEFCRVWNLDLYENPNLTGLEVITTMKRLSCLYLDTNVARRYNIPELAPQLTEHVDLGGISLYVWPEKYFD